MGWNPIRGGEMPVFKQMNDMDVVDYLLKLTGGVTLMTSVLLTVVHAFQYGYWHMHNYSRSSSHETEATRYEKVTRRWWIAFGVWAIVYGIKYYLL